MLLLSPQHRSWVITIDGIGGIGKSALALEIADNYRRQYYELLNKIGLMLSFGQLPNKLS